MTDQNDDKGISTAHDESNSLDLPTTGQKFRFSAKSKRQDGDVALKLFANAEDLHEAIDPQEEAKLIRKIDLIILPLIAVNYAFFYIGLWLLIQEYCALTDTKGRQNNTLVCRHLWHQRRFKSPWNTVQLVK